VHLTGQAEALPPRKKEAPRLGSSSSAEVEATPDVGRGFAEPRTRRRRLWTKLRPQSTIKILSSRNRLPFIGFFFTGLPIDFGLMLSRLAA
jgi:hypothetical protein